MDMWINLYLSIGLSLLIAWILEATIDRWRPRLPWVAHWVGKGTAMAFWPVFLVLLILFR